MFKKTKVMLNLAVLFLAVLGSANSWALKTTVGKAEAPVGGTFRVAMSNPPATLNPINSSDLFASEIQAYVVEGLLTKNIETFEWEPALAEKFEVAKDGMSYTFTIRQGVKFHDGSPLTVEDVKFSFDAVKDPRFGASHRVPYFENIDRIEIVDAKTIRFYNKKKYYKDLDVLGTTEIVSKKMYEDPAKKNNKTLVGTGPYIMDKYEQNKSITLKKNMGWWGMKEPHMMGFAKPEKIFIKFINDDNAKLEQFKKGDLDHLSLTAEQYVKKTDGEIFGKTVFKKEVDSQAPRGISFVGFNLKKKLFQDVKVRRALTHLFNRRFMIEKFRYGNGVLASGPWYPQNPSADPNMKPLEFDVEKAKKLLKEAGWEDSDKDGLLDKTIDGQKTKFVFTVLNTNPNVEKYFTVFKEDLKKAGIELIIKTMEWNAFSKKLDDRDYDTIAMAWSGAVDPDPKQIWHTDSARDGGSNYISYSNPKVDDLIEKARSELNRDKRTKQLREVYRLVGEDCPYIFMWSERVFYYGYSKHMQMVKPTYKYGIGVDAWWIEPAK